MQVTYQKRKKMETYRVTSSFVVKKKRTDKIEFSKIRISIKMNGQSRWLFIELPISRVYCIYKGGDRKRTKKTSITKKK